MLRVRTSRAVAVPVIAIVALAGPSHSGAQPAGPQGVLLSPRIVPAGALRERVLVAFKGGSDAALPQALTMGPDGSFYGNSVYGGDPTKCSGPSWSGCGTVFKLTRSGRGYVESVLYRFKNGTDGAFPIGKLVVDARGDLYGTASSGGASGGGTVFELTPIGLGYAFNVIYAFQGGDDAYQPQGLMVDGTGTFYGTTQLGGDAGCGTVYRLAPQFTAGATGYVESVLYSFLGSGGPSGTCYSPRLDGSDPNESIAEDDDGALYGTTSFGGGLCRPYGFMGCGTAFKLSPSQGGYSETIIYRFRHTGRNGELPKGGLILDGSTGALYGATSYGGHVRVARGEFGVVFRLSPTTSGYEYRALYRFNGGSDGAYPSGTLVATAAGDLLGATSRGGNPSACVSNGYSGCGTVFELSRKTNGEYRQRVLYRFSGGTDGAYPAFPLLSNDGLVYGTTYDGGGSTSCPNVPGCGTAFALHPR
jgi:uncharacterized repeat protein (TIGR03803 family)